MEKEKYFNIKKVSTTSPIEILGIFFKNAYNDDGSLKSKFASCVIKNISNKAIKSIFGSVIGIDQSSDETISVDFEFVETINFNPGISYGSENFFKVPLKMDKPFVKINKIIFENDLKIEKTEFDQDSPKIEEQEIDFESVICDYIKENISQDLKISKYFLPKVTEAAFICFCGEINHSTNNFCNKCNTELSKISEITKDKILKYQNLQKIRYITKVNDLIKSKKFSEASEILLEKQTKHYLNQEEISDYKTLINHEIFYITDYKAMKFSLNELRKEILKIDNLMKLEKYSKKDELLTVLESFKKDYEEEAISKINKIHGLIINSHEKIIENFKTNKTRMTKFIKDPDVIFVSEHYSNQSLNKFYTICKNLINEHNTKKQKRFIVAGLILLLTSFISVIVFNHFDRQAKINDKSYMMSEINDFISSELSKKGVYSYYLAREVEILGISIELFWYSSVGNIVYYYEDQIFDYRSALVNGDDIRVEFKYLDVEGNITQRINEITKRYTFPPTACDNSTLCVIFSHIEYRNSAATNTVNISVTLYNYSNRKITAIEDFNFKIFKNNQLLATYNQQGINNFSTILTNNKSVNLSFTVKLSELVSLENITIDWGIFTYYYNQ